MIGMVGFTLRMARTICPVGSITQRRNWEGEQGPGPAVEQHQRLGPRLGLGQQVVGRRLHQGADQLGEQLRLAIGHAAGGGEVAAAMALHHVAGDGPGAAGEADQRDLLGMRVERGADQPHGLHDGRGIAGADGRGRARRSPRRCGRGSSCGPSPSAKRSGWPMAQGTMRMSENRIAAIHAVAADRLQRDLGRQLRVGAERDEVAGLGPDLAVFRQVAAGLAHQPHRRRPDGLPGQGAQHGLRGLDGGRVIGLVAWPGAGRSVSIALLSRKKTGFLKGGRGC